MSIFENYPRVTPFLWFSNQAEDAVNFYLSIFENSSRLEVVHNTGAGRYQRTYSQSPSN